MTDLSDLTPRQLEVLDLVGEGLTDKQIGARLTMSYNTVRVHVVALAFRLGIDGGMNTRVLLARWWWANRGDDKRDAA